VREEEELETPTTQPTTTLGAATLGAAGPISATPPAALGFTPENVPCLRGCRHYFVTRDHFDAMNSGRRFVEATHLCTAVPWQLDFSADEPPYECNRWDPLQTHEIGPLEKRREDYYRENPSHIPLPLEERLLLDIDEPDRDPGDTQAAHEYLELCRLGNLPEELMGKAGALWTYFCDDERAFVAMEIEADGITFPRPSHYHHIGCAKCPRVQPVASEFKLELGLGGDAAADQGVTIEDARSLGWEPIEAGWLCPFCAGKTGE